jgi:hypothetical protein
MSGRSLLAFFDAISVATVVAVIHRDKDSVY